MNERERYEQLMEQPNAVFVFGSNLAGLHGGGAARAAHKKYGAEWGVGYGAKGRSYALPTMSSIGHVLRLDEIAIHATRFLQHAAAHPESTFVLTRIGCGIAGYSDSEIAPLFANAPANVVLPHEWADLV